MSTISIEIYVDEVALRELCPELDSTAAIQAWAQELIDLRMLQMRMEEEETLDLEEVRELLHKTVCEVYTKC